MINAQTIEIVNDGQDGTEAVIRTCGPDDLLDFVNPSSQVLELGFPLPPLADDTDLEIEGCTSYRLAPLKDFVRVDTEVFNNEPTGGPLPDPLPLLVGDWLNPSGELDTFARGPGANSLLTPAATGLGPPVASSLGTLGFYGFDEAAGVDYAHPVPLPRRTRPPGPSSPSAASSSCSTARRGPLTLISRPGPLPGGERRRQHHTRYLASATARRPTPSTWRTVRAVATDVRAASRWRAPRSRGLASPSPTTPSRPTRSWPRTSGRGPAPVRTTRAHSRRAATQSLPACRVTSIRAARRSRPRASC